MSLKSLLFGIITANLFLNSAIAEENLQKETRSLYEKVNSEWLKNTEIPGDKPGTSNFLVLKDRVDNDLKLLFENLSKSTNLNEDEKKLLAFYQSYLDFDQRKEVGLDPIKETLNSIDEVKTHKDVALLFADHFKAGITVPVVFAAGPDFKNSTRYVNWAVQAGLGMPSRSFYLNDDERSKAQRIAYKNHLSALFKLADISDPEIRAEKVLTLETGLAKIQWAPEQVRDNQKTYNLRNFSEMERILSSLELKEVFKKIGIPENVTINAAELSYFEEFNLFFPKTDIESWKDYLRARLLLSYSHILTEEFHAEEVKYQKVLGMIQEDEPQWKQAIGFVESVASMLVGKVYVKHYFDENKKQEVDSIVKAIQTAGKETISESKKLSPITKKKALEKFDQMSFNIGYPDQWKDYSNLVANPKNLVENFKNSNLFELDLNNKKLLKPIDPNEWDRSPHEINAFYDSTKNKFVLLAGILQAPFYKSDSSDAAKFGGIGFVIGHEIGHAFDDSGSQFDGAGNLNNWWTDSDRAQFNKAKTAIIDQANKFEILPGVFLNGALEIGEIIGDATGSNLALRAFNKVIAQKGLDKKSSHQQFFTQLASVWREKLRPDFQKLLLAVDGHPPGKFRTDGIVKNMTEFHVAFDTKPGDPMYLPADKRVVIW